MTVCGYHICEDPRLLMSDIENLFAFAHLGMELYMKDHPTPCQLASNRVPDIGEFKVHIVSNFTPDQIARQRDEAVASGKAVRAVYRWLQYIPLAGRLFAHAGTNVCPNRFSQAPPTNTMSSSSTTTSSIALASWKLSRAHPHSDE